MNTNTQRKVFEIQIKDLKEEVEAITHCSVDLGLLLIDISNKEEQLTNFNTHSEHLAELEKELIYAKGFDTKQHIRNAITATNEALTAVVRGGV